MISGKIIVFIFFWSLLSFGEGVSFIQRGKLPLAPPNQNKKATNNEQQNALVLDLKYQAVTEWLQSYLKERFSVFESTLSKEFAEKYILDYRVSKNAQDKSIVEVTGHLDADALMRWIRTQESKHGQGNSLVPIFIMTSSVAGTANSPIETSTKMKDSALIQASFSQASQSFQKWVPKFLLPEPGRAFPLSPPKQEADVGRLRELGQNSNANSLFWMDWSNCKGCSGTRLDLYFYHFNTGRILFSRSEEVAVSTGELANSAKIKAALKQPLHLAVSDLEELISNGLVDSSNYSVGFEGVDSHRTYKLIEQLLSHLDFVVRAIPQQIEGHAATFEVASSLKAQELATRLISETISGYSMKLTKADGNSILIQLIK